MFHGLNDLLPILHNVDPETAKLIDMEPYTHEQFYNDVMRVSGGRADPGLADVLVNQSRDTIDWLSKVGIQFRLSFNRQAYKVDGRYKFWGGMVLSVKVSYLFGTGEHHIASNHFLIIAMFILIRMVVKA